MAYSKSQKGIIPLFILVAIGVAVLVGGAYVIRNQFVKTGESGLSALDEDKIRQQQANPTTLPSLTPTTKAELQTGVFTSPDVPESPDFPIFTINAPAGWNRVSSPGVVVRFISPEKDEQLGEDVVASFNAKVEILADKLNGVTLDQLLENTIAESNANFETFEVNTKSKTTFAGQAAYRLESRGFKQGVAVISVGYLLTKDGYAFLINGAALENSWDKHAGAIEASINTFRFVE